jgi:hypothetical protein
MATRNFWAAAARAENRLIAACTSLKTKLELTADGVQMECGEFTTTLEAANWMAKKASYYKFSMPLSVIRFNVI